MVRRVRHPRFDGYVCLVKECTCVDYKHGLCRKHWHEVPLSDRMSIMTDAAFVITDSPPEEAIELGRELATRYGW